MVDCNECVYNRSCCQTTKECREHHGGKRDPQLPAKDTVTMKVSQLKELLRVIEEEGTDDAIDIIYDIAKQNGVPNSDLSTGENNQPAWHSMFKVIAEKYPVRTKPFALFFIAYICTEELAKDGDVFMQLHNNPKPQTISHLIETDSDPDHTTVMEMKEWLRHEGISGVIHGHFYVIDDCDVIRDWLAEFRI